jgi:hypothetical protein
MTILADGTLQFMTPHSSTLARAQEDPFKNVYHHAPCILACLYCVGFSYVPIKDENYVQHAGPISGRGGKGRAPNKEILAKYKPGKPSRDDQFFIDTHTGKPSRLWEKHARQSKYLMPSMEKSIRAAEMLDRAHEQRVKKG